MLRMPGAREGAAQQLIAGKIRCRPINKGLGATPHSSRGLSQD